MALAAKMAKLVRIAATGGLPWLWALRFGVAAGIEHARVLRSLGRVSTVVDIGANRGQFALAARRCFPNARIIAFEPLAGPARVFERLFASDSGVALHRTAVGSSSGEVLIHVSARDDSSSLLPITALQSHLFPGTAEAGTEKVQVGRLADFIAGGDLTPPALLKLDVQGFELEALKGCEDLLDRFAWVYAECSFVELYQGQALGDEVIAWLRERGFALCGVYHTAYDGRGKAVQADFLFENRGSGR
ncbi:MAG: FkbM family methyltransferase [Gammaproteobacteria bacterium]